MRSQTMTSGVLTFTGEPGKQVALRGFNQRGGRSLVTIVDSIDAAKVASIFIDGTGTIPKFVRPSLKDPPFFIGSEGANVSVVGGGATNRTQFWYTMEPFIPRS